MKKCNEVMTKNPVCCLPDDLVTKAAQLMKSEHVGSIPVIENEADQKIGRYRDRSRSNFEDRGRRTRRQIHKSGDGHDAQGSNLQRRR